MHSVCFFDIIQNMNEWFTIEKIDDDTFALSEYKHWEETHSYLLLGKKRALIIDSGLGVGDIKCAVKKITALPVTVATTHVHWDHIGGHALFDDVAVFGAEKSWLTDSFPIPLAMVKSFLTKEPCDFPQDFSIENYSVCRREPAKILHDGQKIDLGGRTLLVVHTPGHSPGHCCFFEPERGYLFSGDLIYKGKLDAFYPTTDPMQFMHSIKKVKKLPVKKILPGHHSLDVPVDLIEKIGLAFKQLYAQNKLHHGSGIFDFEEFSLHI